MAMDYLTQEDKNWIESQLALAGKFDTGKSFTKLVVKPIVPEVCNCAWENYCDICQH